MSVRDYPNAPDTGGIAKGTGLSGASTGDKLIYTCPTGKQAEVCGAWINPTAGAATIGFKAVLSGTNVVLQSGTVGQQLQGRLSLNAGDSLRLTVSTLDAASVFDGCITSREYPAA